MNPLIVVDFGGTIGDVVGPGRDVPSILAKLTPPGFPKEIIIDVVQRVLNRAPILSEDMIYEVCDNLLISPEYWPRPWPAVDFAPFPETEACLARLVKMGTVVGLTNQSVTAKPAVERVGDEFGEYFSGIYTSYEQMEMKPNQSLWRYIAQKHRANTSDIIHIGDRWTEDVLAPLYVGAHAAVYISDQVKTDPRPDVGQRWLQARTLTAAVELVESLLRVDREREL